MPRIGLDLKRAVVRGGVVTMMDIVSVSAAVVFFLVALAYTTGCDRLTTTKAGK